MTGDRTGEGPKRAAARRKGKGAAHEIIGKLIGDDAAVRDGRAAQDDVRPTSNKTSDQQE
ncbi:hypothetical protein [Sphingomonas sp. TZW2008]|uniref:hypothetical protein n=1 Tax=Sphingomonas sp. TZW2008 TaxID=1917973 RepID=UPI000A271677|nr:hypothetical protein [Sphingomonas sp. TZW2008]